MAQEQVNVDLIIETAESARNLGELKKSMNEVRGALDKVGIGSKEFTKLNAALDDGAQRLRTFRRGFDGLQAFETFGRTIASSFTLASGAIAQFAGDNDELQKSLTRVGSALALLQGFSGLAESMKAAREANLALNASLLTNPYVLVAAGIAAVALALVTQTSSTKEATKAQEEYNAALQEMYAGMASGVIQDYTTEVDNLYLLNLSQKDLLEQTVAIREKELSQVESLTFFTSALSVQRESLRDKESKLLQVRKELANTSTPQLIQKEKELTAQVKQLKVDISDLTKANKDLFDARKALSDFNTKSQVTTKTEIEDVKNISKYIDLYNDELTNVTRNMDSFLVKQMDVNKVSKDTYNSFRDVATTIQSNSIAYKNLIEGIKDFNPDKQFGGFTKTTQGILFDNLVLKGLMDAQKASINSQFEILNTALFEKPAEFADAAKIIAKKISSEQIQIYTELYQRLIQLGDTPKGAIEKLSGFKFNLTTELTDLNERLVKDFGLSEVAAKNLTNLINGYFKDSIGTVKKFQKDLESGLIIPDDILKVNRDKIKEMEGEYLVLSDVLSHQEDVLKKVGATDKQISEERYNNLIKLKGELEKISEVVSSSILPDDEKSKKTEELTKRINDLRQALELLGIELGKPSDEWEDNIRKIANESAKTLAVIDNFANGLSQIFTKTIENRLNSLDAQNSESVQMLDAQLNASLLSQQQYNEKRRILDKKYSEEVKAAKKEQWQNDKAAAVISATIGVANAVINGLNTTPLVPLGIASAALAGTLGAIQLATIISQPMPAFAEGGYVVGPGGPKDDSITAKLSNGEYVVNSKSTSMFSPILDAINSFGNYSFNGVGGNNQTSNVSTPNSVSSPIPQPQNIKVELVWRDVIEMGRMNDNIKARTTF